MIKKMKINQSKLIAFVMMLLSSFASQAAEITDTYTAGDAVTVTTMDNIKSAVNDNDARITTLEGSSPAIGRMAISVSDGTPNKSLADAVITSAASNVFPTPGDYVSGTVTIKALVSGCGGSNARVSISTSGVNTGVNSFFLIFPVYQTIAIPAGTITTFSVVEVTTTATALSDLNTVSLTRDGTDAADTCATDLFVRGFIIEYPRG